MPNTRISQTNITERVVGLLTVIKYSNELSTAMRDSFDKIYNSDLDANVSNIANQVFAGAGISVIKKMHDELVERGKRGKADASVSPEEIFLSVKGEVRLLSEQDKRLAKDAYPLFNTENYDDLGEHEKRIFEEASRMTSMYAKNSTSRKLVEMLGDHNELPKVPKDGQSGSAIMTGYVRGSNNTSHTTSQSNVKKHKTY